MDVADAIYCVAKRIVITIPRSKEKPLPSRVPFMHICHVFSHCVKLYLYSVRSWTGRLAGLPITYVHSYIHSWSISDWYSSVSVVTRLQTGRLGRF
jgi:hypothetical protein